MTFPSPGAPAFLEVLFRTREFEVINVDDKEKLELRVEVAARPFKPNLYKTDASTMFIHFLFPIIGNASLTQNTKWSHQYG